MEQFIVSARKYRPQTFEEVVGQQAITNTLENAIKNNHLAQALLFTGPRGVGKTTCARILAKKINENAGETSEDDFAFNIFELDAASNNSVDDIRSLTDQVRIPPQTGKYKVYIIDEVHMLSQAAFNAFLKTLEEPPAHAIFILATTEKHKIIPTILSRCQIFDFKRIGVLDAKKYLEKIAKEENINAEDDALHIIAQKADGAMRDALSIFDRVVSFSGNELTRKAVTENLNVLDYDEYFITTDFLLQNKIPEVLIHFNTILAKGFEGHHFISGLASHFRDLLVAKDQITIDLLEVGDNAKKKYLEQSKKCEMRFLLQAIDLANDCDLKYKASKNQRLLVELALMQLASITFDGEKKNSKPYIIAAIHYRQKIKRTVKNKQPQEVKLAEVKQEITKKSVEEVAKPALAKPTLNTRPRRTSALTLKSIHLKKEIAETEVEFEEVEGLPSDPFTQTQAVELWNAYIEKLLKKGHKSVASIMKADVPTAKGNELHYTLPNLLMKDQLTREKTYLMKFLRECLNNFKTDLIIHVNESETKKFAYTPQERYEKLKEKNSALELFKKTFDLDL
ncbi:DNA polymerase-3 subunit gamma/tau [Lutibacter agarilyticus]|uniref:DNA polymerase III subunit gamma/tau n=1 Tax=Lutibacter agarilyticus TaxID=1109740 RepID=A0A238XHW4_9FLAO|nr:DNA polymerase III subunit gamma/tau [Lutibacter agarilyticus]SNR58151.1 DNA polymerase-3 subunit gamma/tau [Lutibacter agarilyticus]